MTELDVQCPICNKIVRVPMEKLEIGSSAFDKMLSLLTADLNHYSFDGRVECGDHVIMVTLNVSAGVVENDN